MSTPTKAYEDPKVIAAVQAAIQGEVLRQCDTPTGGGLFDMTLVAKEAAKAYALAQRELVIGQLAKSEGIDFGTLDLSSPALQDAAAKVNELLNPKKDL